MSLGDVVILQQNSIPCPAGGIFISEVVLELTNKKGLDAVFVIEQTLKNVKEPVRIYEIQQNRSNSAAPVAPATVHKRLAEKWSCSLFCKHEQ